MHRRPPEKKWSKQAKDQLLAKTKKDYIRLLKKDSRWEHVSTSGAVQAFRNPSLPKPQDYLTIHYHPKERFNNWSLLKQLLEQICWTENSLKKQKTIK